MAKKIVVPIKPNEILDNLEKIIPQPVFEAINALLSEQYRGGSVTITLKDIVAKIATIDRTLTKDILFSNKYLDFEKVYRDNGWVVSYEQSGYGDSNFDSYYTFKAK